MKYLVIIFSLLLAAVLLMPFTVANAQTTDQITIATGKTGGGYDRASRALSERLRQRQIESNVVNLDGSDAITLAMAGGAADVGFTQIDGIYRRALEGVTLKPVGIYGEEIAIILFPPDSSIDALDEMDASSKILVDTVGSGTELFWRTIVQIETGEDGNNSPWASATPVNDMVSMANTMASFGDIDAVLLVRSAGSDDITNLLSLGWKLGELWDRDINDLKFNGQPLYESKEFEIQKPGSRRAAEDWGYVVRSFIVVTEELQRNRDLYRRIQASLQ